MYYWHHKKEKVQIKKSPWKGFEYNSKFKSRGNSNCCDKIRTTGKWEDFWWLAHPNKTVNKLVLFHFQFVLFSISNQDASEYAHSFQYNGMANEEDPFAEIKPYIIYEEVRTADYKLLGNANNENSSQTAAVATAAITTPNCDSKHGILDVVMKCEVVSVSWPSFFV